jgi:hypothetical protein
MAARTGALESSVLAPAGAPVIRNYEPPPPSPRAPASPPAAASSLSAASLPGSLAPPHADKLDESVVFLPPTGTAPAQLPTEAASAAPSPAASPTSSVLGSSGAPSLNSPEKAREKPNRQPDNLPASPPLKSGSISMRTLTGEEDPADSLAYRVAGKAYKIIQHFVIRSPHVFVAITTTFLTFKYFNDEPFAWEAATYVGVASAVYCIIRPLFLMIIPYSLLPRKTNDFWRHAINTTNTILITISLTSAIWGLKISAVQGTAIWGASFVVPYKLLSKHYPDLDAQFPNSEIKQEKA